MLATRFIAELCDALGHSVPGSGSASLTSCVFGAEDSTHQQHRSLDDGVREGVDVLRDA